MKRTPPVEGPGLDVPSDSRSKMVGALLAAATPDVSCGEMVVLSAFAFMGCPQGDAHHRNRRINLGVSRRPFSMAMTFRDIESGMASQFKFAADARDDGILIVTEERSHSSQCMRSGQTGLSWPWCADRPPLIMSCSLPPFREVSKARELGWMV